MISRTVDWEQMEAEEMQRLAQLEQLSSTKRWAKYPRPNPFSHEFGYGSTLYKLQGDMHNTELSPISRAGAAQAHAKIVMQLKDKRLMHMRERLIKAAKAGDLYEQHKIGASMKAHNYEDRETGLTDE